jgi:3-oxoacyl-[acyl-carrier-protein] synthase II
MNSDSCRKVVVTGIGVISSLGRNVEEFRRNLFAGKSGIKGIESFDASRFRTRIGAEIGAFDFAPYVERKRLHTMDRQSLLAVVASEEAIADAGLNMDADRFDMGVVLGGGLGPSSSIESAVIQGMNKERMRPTCVLKIMLSSPVAALCERYQCRGVSNMHVTACAASSHAIAQAADYILRGESELCLAGGCDAFPSETLFAAWDALEVMTDTNDRPGCAVRPFSKGRNGFAIGEGAAVLVLESRARAERRGARILAELAGSGRSSHAPNMTKPSLEGMASAMSKAVAAAGIAAGEVVHINAHGTATEINDLLETQAVREVFGSHAKRLHISSTKAAHGHAMGASGAIEAVTTILALCDGIAPPTLNLLDQDPACDLDCTALNAASMDGEYALSNSFAFGGQYVSLAFKRE